MQVKHTVSFLYYGYNYYICNKMYLYYGASSEISPSGVMPSRIACEPRFEVRMMMVFLKSTVLPCESVMRPSSSTCSRMLNTSGCAFSISSNRTTEYGLAAHGFGQLAALLVAHISGRRTDQTRHGELLHILRHIDAHQVLFIVKQRLCQRLGKLCLADARGAKEQERADGAVRVLNACSAALDGLGDDAHGLVLADNTLVQRIFEMQQLLAFALHQSCETGCPSSAR